MLTVHTSTLVTQARSLESEIDGKLATLQRAASTAGVGVRDALLAGDSLDAQVTDLESLLQRLADVSTAMAGAVKGGVGDSRAHTLARHKDIYAEYQSELRRAKNAVQQSRESAELLGSGRVSGGLNGNDHFGDSSAGSQLMRERGTIMSSTSKVDDVIGQAHREVAALLEGGRGPLEVRASLVGTAAPGPREAWVAVDGRRAERVIDPADYSLSLRGGDALVPMPDPLTARIASFVDQSLGARPCPWTRPGDLARRASMLEAAVVSHRAACP